MKNKNIINIFCMCIALFIDDEKDKKLYENNIEFIKKMLLKRSFRRELLRTIFTMVLNKEKNKDFRILN